MRPSEIKVLFFGLLPIVALLIGDGLVSAWNARHVFENEGWVAHSREVLGTLQKVRATISEAEAGQRGYLITGAPRYLQTFEKAAGRVGGQVGQLQALVSDNPRQATRAAGLEALVEARLQRLRRNVSVRESQGDKAAFGIVETDVGDRIMQHIRAEITLMEQAEDALLVQRTVESKRSLDVAYYTNILEAFIGIVAITLAFVLFRRTLREREKQEAKAKARAAHQTALGDLRQYALSDADLDALMDRAVHWIARTLDVPMVKILELLPGDREFLLRAGTGWKEGCVGTAVISAGLDSQAGYTLRASHPVVVGDLTTYEPIVVDDMEHEPRFSGPALLREHGAVSGVSVIIHDRPERPFGVLGVHTTHRRVFTDDELQFVQEIANVLAVAAQRRWTEDALRDSESRFRALAESVPGVVWTSLPDGKCDYVNRHWSQSIGMPIDSTLGMGWATALHEEDAERSMDRWLRSMETGEPFECEYRFRMKDGTYRWWLGRALPLRDAQGHIVKWFGHCADIEDHKRMEEALIEADRHKDQFLAMLGHELRNPLAPIVNVLELLKRRATADIGLQWEVDAIDRQVRHMTRLVDDLLDAARIGRGEIRLERAVVELSEILTRAIEVGRPLIDERRHTLETAFPDEPIYLDADATRLIQSIGNLLANAAKYTPPGGHIRLDAQREDDEVVIRVRDDGVGISADMLPRIFEIFVQAKAAEAAHDGLGIGLALVKKLVHMHGGSVDASSDGLGHGSEFRIRLPALPRERVEQQLREVDPAPASGLPPFRVLVVEDNAMIADTFARLLHDDGCDTRVAVDGETALRIAREFRPEVVFLDLGLPDMDGYEVARRLRSDPMLENVLLVAMTGYGQSGNERHADDTDFQHYLVKPVRFGVVERLLREYQAPPAYPRPVPLRRSSA